MTDEEANLVLVEKSAACCLEKLADPGAIPEEGSFRPWILRILSIRCKRKIGQYIAGRNELDIDDFLDLSDRSPGVEERSTEKLALLNALETLTPQERQIVALAVVQGYTVRETAEILGAPQGTVSAKLHRTLKKLRAQLER